MPASLDFTLLTLAVMFYTHLGDCYMFAILGKSTQTLILASQEI